MKKYDLIKIEDGKNIGLFRVKALKDFAGIKMGTVGGYVESEDNLSQEGECWVADDAIVFGNARVRGVARVYGDAGVYGDACVRGGALVFGDARVYGEARVRGDAIVRSMKDYLVFKNWWSSGRYFTWTRSNNLWSVGCFLGTGSELVKKAFEDSELSGREYERIVNYVSEINDLLK